MFIDISFGRIGFQFCGTHVTSITHNIFRFGFRSDLAQDASLEDKAERLRRKAEDEKDNVITEVNDPHEVEVRSEAARGGLELSKMA